jgi:hypothetical protein
MAIEYIEIGEAGPGIAEAALKHERSKALLRILARSSVGREFSIIELRRDGDSDVIIADCICDQVPSRNKAGIHGPRASLRSS